MSIALILGNVVCFVLYYVDLLHVLCRISGFSIMWRPRPFDFSVELDKRP